LLRPAGLFLPGGALWQLGQLAQKTAAKKSRRGNYAIWEQTLANIGSSR
jgi:hypothetical protein